MSGSGAEVVAVLVSRVRADEKRLFAALDRRSVPYRHLDGRTMSIEADGHRPEWTAVLNREISHSRAVAAARGLEALGVPVLNSAAATEICGDKWRTTLALRAAGLPVPRTTLALTPEAAPDAIEALGYPVVVKPLVGSWGRLVTLVPDRRTAETVLEYVAALSSPASHLVYAQEYVRQPGRDLRVVVVGGQALGATYRRSTHWRSNVARGAVSEHCELDQEVAKLAVAAAAAVGAEVAGVDLIEDAGGEPLVLEVNHGVEFSGFQHAMGNRVDVADRVVDHLLARIA